MDIKNLFSVDRTSKRLNESLAKKFGAKLNLESFDLHQLQDARNKLRTQISQIRQNSGFNENLENDAFIKAQFMLDAINSEIAERDEFAVNEEEVDLEEDDIDPDGRIQAEIEKFLATNPKDGDDLSKFHDKAIMDKNKELDDYLTFLYDYVADQTGAGGTEEAGVYDEMLDMLHQMIADKGWSEGVEEGKGSKALKKAEDYLAYMSDVFNDREEYDLANELHNLSFDLDKIGIGGVMKELKQLTYWDDPLAKGVYKEFSKKFGKFAEGFDGDVEEGMMKDVDYDLHMLAREEDEDQLIDALRGDMGQGVADVLNDMMEELKDELASKGMNDVMRDDDKMIEMLMDKLVDEFGEGDFDPADEGGETDDDYALASAGRGSDEDYESINNEVSPPGFKGTVKAMKKHKDIDNPYALAWHMKKKGYKSHKKADGSDKNESVEQGDEMTTLREGEVQQASAIVTAKTMVDRVGRWIEELSGMENETLLQLGDSIRDEMGQEQSRAFIEQVAPAIQQALEILKGTRETLSSGVNTLATGEQPADMLGAEPAPEADTEGDMTEPAPEVEEPAGDEFSAAEPAAGGAEAAGREQRESVSYQNRLLKVLAG